MAYELIFGDKTLPRSDEVTNLLLSLKDRDDVKRFSDNLRLRVAGGQEEIDKRQQQVSDVIKHGDESFNAGDFEAAHRFYIEASEINGALMFDLLRKAITALTSLKRFEEAAVLVFAARHCYRWDTELFEGEIAKIYHQLGYVQFAKTIARPLMKKSSSFVLSEDDSQQQQQQNRSFDDADLEAAFQDLFTDGKPLYHYIFLMTRILYHFKFRFKATMAVVTKRRLDFISRLSANSTLTTYLKTGTNCEKMTITDLHSLEIIFALFREIKEARKEEFIKEMMRSDWFLPMIQLFATTLVSKPTLIRIAVAPTGTWKLLLIEWILFMQTQMDKITNAVSLSKDVRPGSKLSKKTTQLVPPPFNSFDWYCKLLCLSFFSGNHIQSVRCHDKKPADCVFDSNDEGNVLGQQKDESKPRSFLMDSGPFAGLIMCKWLQPLCEDKLELFGVDDELPLEEWSKSLDLLLLATTVTFAEWLCLDDVHREYEYKVLKPKTFTTDVHRRCCHGILSTLSGNIKNTMTPAYLVEHVPYLAVLFARLECWADNFDNVNWNNVDEMMTLTEVALVETFYQAERASQLALFVDAPQMVENNRLISLFPLLFEECGESEVDIGLKLFAFLATASEKFASRAIFTDNPLANSIVKFIFKQPLDTLSLSHCLAVVLRGADKECRERWAVTYSVSLHRLARCLFNAITARNDHQTPIEEFINMLLSFHAIFAKRPEFVPFKTIISDVNATPREFKAAATKLCSLVRDFSSWYPSSQNEFKGGYSMLSIYTSMGATVAGIVCAAMSDADTRFARMLKNLKSYHDTVYELGQHIENAPITLE